MSTGALGRQFRVQVEGPHPFGGEWASLHDGDQHVGQMRFRRSSRFSELPDHTTVEHITVDESHRGQGGAQALYRGVHEATGQPFLHYRDEMTPEARRAVAKSAAALPGVHREQTWRNGDRVVRAFPRRR